MSLIKTSLHPQFKKLSVLFLLISLLSPLAFADDNEERSSFGFLDTFSNLFLKMKDTYVEKRAEYQPLFPEDAKLVTGHPRHNEIINQTNQLTSGFTNHKISVQGSMLSFDTNCFKPFSILDPFEDLSNMQLCNKQNIYREDYANERILPEMRRPDQYVLNLDPQNISSYCSCVRSRSARYGVEGPANSEENMSERKRIIDNLLKTGMDRLAERFNSIAPKVMYALTSREMSSLHLSEQVLNDEGGERKKIFTQKSALNSCAPGQFGTLMNGLLDPASSRGQALCSPEGAKRLGQGFISGRSSDCKGDKSDAEHCKNTSTGGMILQTDIDPETAIREIGRHISNSGALEFADTYLNRHHRQILERGHRNKTDIVPVLNIEILERRLSKDALSWQNDRRKRIAENNLSDSEIQEFRAKHANRFSKVIQDALANEISLDGLKLWEENNSPIIDAMKVLSEKGSVKPDQITGNLEYFKDHVRSNPYLSRYFPSIQDDDEEKIKKEIIDYVSGPLKRMHDYIKRHSDDKDNISISQINEAMFLTYRDDYKETVTECEDIQKTLISLCKAATNFGPEVEKVSDFFTDPLLIDLFREDDFSAYKGGVGHKVDDMVKASGLFCQEVFPSERIKDLNDESRSRQLLLNNTPFLAGVRDLRKFLTDIGSDPTIPWVASQTEYLKSESGQADAKPANVTSESTGNSYVLNMSSEDNVASVRYAATSTNKSNINNKELKDTASISVYNEGDIPKAIPVDEETLQPIKVKSANVESDFEEIKTETSPNLIPELAPNNPASTSFADKFINLSPSTQEQGVFGVKEEPDPNNLANTTDQANEVVVDPLQAELLAQLEKMKEREQEMAQQIAELKESVEEEEEQRMVEKYEQEQAALRQKVESLTTQLNERKAEQEKPKVTTSAPSQGFDGTLGGSRGRSSTASAPRVQPTSSSNSQQASAPSAPASVPQSLNRSAPNSFSGRSNLAGGSLGLTSQTVQSSAARSSGQRSQMNSIVSVDANLASIARSVEGNTALRQTADPQILEKIIFKEVDGEIVFENGEPVIERTELLTLEEAKLLEEQEALAQAELLKEEEANERAPASIEEEMEAIEQSLYPRSRTYTVEELADELRRGKSLQDE